MNFRLWLVGMSLALAVAPLGAADRALRFEAEQSTVDIVVKATVDSFTGRLASYDLTGSVDETGRIKSAHLTFRFREVLTGKPKRDKAMHAWQDTAAHPDADFLLTALTGDAAAGHRAIGRFTFHGVTRELSFPVAIAQQGAVYAIDGDAPIDTREFGLPIIRMMGVLKVDPIVHVRFHFQGRAE